jgi:hypothetical protein
MGELGTVAVIGVVIAIGLAGLWFAWNISR